MGRYVNNVVHLHSKKKIINRLHTFRKTTATRSFTALYYLVLGSLPPQKFVHVSITDSLKSERTNASNGMSFIPSFIKTRKLV